MSVKPLSPVGQPKTSPELTSYIETIQKSWDAVTTEIGKGLSNVHVTQFMLGTLDALVIFVQNLMSNESGATKKATVLAALVTVYQYVVAQTFPIWLKPFSGQIQSFLINVLASAAIDWMVAKYSAGAWNLPATTA